MPGQDATPSPGFPGPGKATISDEFVDPIRNVRVDEILPQCPPDSGNEGGDPAPTPDRPESA